MPGLGDFLQNMFQPRQPMSQQPGQAFQDPMQGMGPMDRLGYMRQNNPEALMGLAAGLMQGDLGKGFALAGDQMGQHRKEYQAQQKQSRQENMTKRWLMTNKGLSDEEAQLAVDSGMVGEYLKGQAEPTSDIRNYEYAKQQGYNGSFNDFQLEKAKAGGTNVTVGGGKYGTIPQGYQLDEGPQGATMRPIPGGPEDSSKKDALAKGQADVATRVVTTAAQRARDAAGQRNFGHVGQGIAASMPWTDSAEVSRQVEVLKSTAKVENLTAMRAASPTGGALGSVTEKEADMLAAKSGALDPSSPTFQRDLDDYELTLLQVVHGPQEGSRIFSQTRGGGQSIQAPAQGGGANQTRSGVQWSIEP